MNNDIINAKGKLQVSQLRTRVQYVCLITSGINYFNVAFMRVLGN